MWNRLVPYSIVGLAVCCCSLSGCGSSDSLSGSCFGSGYELEYAVGGDSVLSFHFHVVVKGPPAYLAVVLTSPTGEQACVQEFLPKDMVNNRVERNPMLLELMPGDYELSLKAFDPERVLISQKIPISLDKIWVADCRVATEPRTSGSSALVVKKIFLTVKKHGNLPIQFGHAWVSLDGGSGNIGLVTKGGLAINNETEVVISVRLMPTPEMQRNGRTSLGEASFRPGDRSVIKGTLSYNHNKDKLEFEKALSF
jgi:hypothetical protein